MHWEKNTSLRFFSIWHPIRSSFDCKKTTYYGFIVKNDVKFIAVIFVVTSWRIVVWRKFDSPFNQRNAILVLSDLPLRCCNNSLFRPNSFWTVTKLTTVAAIVIAMKAYKTLVGSVSQLSTVEQVLRLVPPPCCFFMGQSWTDRPWLFLKSEWG